MRKNVSLPGVTEKTNYGVATFIMDEINVFVLGGFNVDDNSDKYF